MIASRREKLAIMTTPEEAARRLLDSISEPLDIDPGKLARVAGQFITPGKFAAVWALFASWIESYHRHAWQRRAQQCLHLYNHCMDLYVPS